MENLTLVVDSTVDNATPQADLLAIVQLSAHDLALVGGGMANVEFM